MQPTIKQMYDIKPENYPSLIYSTTAIKQILCMLKTTHAANKEFMFLGDVSKIGTDYLVNKVFLVPQQKCGAAYCETDDNKYPEWLAKNVPLEQRKYIRLHGHSHVNMGTSPSGTDDSQIKNLCENVRDYYIQLIINHNLQNTVNIWDKEQKLIFNNVNQYIKINKTLVAFNSRTQTQLLQPVLVSNGTYKIVDNKLKLADNMFLSLADMSVMLVDNNITIHIGKDIQLTNPQDPLLEETEKQAKELIKAMSYSWTDSYKPVNYKPVSYDYNLTNDTYRWTDYDYHYYNYEDVIIYNDNGGQNIIFFDELEQPDIELIKNGEIEIEEIIYGGKSYKMVKKPKQIYPKGSIKLQHKTTKEYKVVSEDEYNKTYKNDNNFTYVGTWCTLINKFIKYWRDDYGLE